MNINYRIIETNSWRLKVPDFVNSKSPVVVIPTIHPRGDQRVTRCAQVALNNGYRVHFIWEGEGEGFVNESITEELVSPSASFAKRIARLPIIYIKSIKSDQKYWHIHDYYMLPFAYLGNFLKGVRVIYDVHEYYPEYYSSKVPLWLHKISSAVIKNFQLSVSKKIGGVNVVAESMSLEFESMGIPTAVSPNYPITDQFIQKTNVSNSPPRNVIHTGSLSESYGMEIILRVAERLHELGSDIRIDVVRRFPNKATETKFNNLLDNSTAKTNLRIIEPVSAHEIASLLTQYRVGLSMICDSGQNDLAVPTKLYEYVMADLHIIGTNKTAQRKFLEDWGCFELFEETEAARMAESINAICHLPFEETQRKNGKIAMKELSWDQGPSNSLGALMLRVFKKSN